MEAIPVSWVKRCNNTMDQPISTASSQSLVAPASQLTQPNTLYSETTALQTHGSDLLPPAIGDIVTTVPSGSLDYNSPSSDPQGSSMFVKMPISYLQPQLTASQNPRLPSTFRIPHSLIANENSVPHSTYTPHIPTCTCKVQILGKTNAHAAVLPQSTASPNVIEPSSYSSVVWAKALQIAKKKLSDNNLPPLDLTNVTSQSAEENIKAFINAVKAEENVKAIVKVLNISQENKKKKRWNYTWQGKEVIVVERLGKILRSVEKYSKVVDTAMQTNPQVSALVWASIWAIMRVQYSV